MNDPDLYAQWRNQLAEFKVHQVHQDKFDTAKTFHRFFYPDSGAARQSFELGLKQGFLIALQDELARKLTNHSHSGNNPEV